MDLFKLFSKYLLNTFGSYSASSQQQSFFCGPKVFLCFVSPQMLALHCERYQGEKLFCCQQTLGELGRIQERWLNLSLQLFRRHTSPDDESSGSQQVPAELGRVLSEILKQLDTQVSGENGEGQ